MGARSPSIGKEVWQGKWAQQRGAQHPPFARMEGCDSPKQALPLNVPLAQSRSFHAGQTLVQGLRLR